jgi:sigma-B regulation protein RsbU (phosphoserine phosphatase)
MRIFRKLLLLFLAAGLLPLACLSLYNLAALRNLGDEAASRSGGVLMEEMRRHIREAVRNYAGIIHQQSGVLELVLRNQARAVEKCLAAGPPPAAALFFLEDPAGNIRIPPDMAPSPRHRMPDGGGTVPRPMSLAAADFQIPRGADRRTAEKEAARLAGMVPACRETWADHAAILARIVVGLESGLLSGYPGMGGYPPEYDVRERTWYRNARKNGRLTWNPPYRDVLGGGTVGNVSMPVYGTDGAFAGAVALEVCNIQGFRLHPGKETEHAEVFLVLLREREGTGGRGLRIAGRNRPVEDGADWKTPLREEWLEDRGGEGAAALVGDLSAGGEAVVSMPFDGRAALWGYGPVGGSGTGTALVMVVPERDVLARARDLRALILGRTRQAARYFIVIAALTVLGTAGIALRFSGAIARPLQALSASTGRIAKGDLDTEIPPVPRNDEVGDLALAVDTMRRDLQAHLRRLTEATAARERMESELRIARAIQMSFLPKRFPSPEDGTGFELYATLLPAREVGGDLYDFHVLDGGRLFFAVGDVSGKGVPAALFMALTRSLMKGIAGTGAGPAEILEEMNRELCRDNETVMFVSVFCGTLDTATGEVLYANAGHNPPLLVRPGVEAEFLPVRRDLVLGGTEGTVYGTGRLVLAPGDGLFLYTDGVTEARRETGEFFGGGRLREAVSPLGGLPPREAVETLLEAGRVFCGEASQSDDIAVLMVRFTGTAAPPGRKAPEG